MSDGRGTDCKQCNAECARCELAWKKAVAKAEAERDAAIAERDDAKGKLNRAIVDLRILTGDVARLAAKIAGICDAREMEARRT